MDSKKNIPLINMENFEYICGNFLETLTEQIEDFDKNSIFEVDYSDGILNIILEDTGQTYVINRHSATKKIWYSSPLTGADYFSFDVKKEEWLNDKGDLLSDKLFGELKTLTKTN